MDIKLEDTSIIEKKISFFARVVKVISNLFLPVALLMGHPVYKEECFFIGLSICLFFMHLVTVKASVTKTSTVYSQDHRKVKAGSARPGRLRRGGWVKLAQVKYTVTFTDFSEILENSLIL
jgi:hypothetical protein